MITVFTPTYNRVHTIVRTYESLERQTCREFEWVIVDDGSSDNTVKVLLELKEKASFSMTIQQQENAGKHVAINNGVRLAKGKLFFIVDSDDWLQPDAIATIQELVEGLPKYEKYAGVAGVRVNPAGELIGTSFDADYIDCTAFERTKYNINGDKAEVYFTDVLRRFPFPTFAGEKFLTESVVWFRIAHEGYKIRWTNKAFYVCDYQINVCRQLRGNVREIIKAINLLQRKCSPIKNCHSKSVLVSCWLMQLFHVKKRRTLRCARMRLDVRAF